MRNKFLFSLISFFFRYNNDNLVNFQNGVAILTKWLMEVSVTFSVEIFDLLFIKSFYSSFTDSFGIILPRYWYVYQIKFAFLLR